MKIKSAVFIASISDSNDETAGTLAGAGSGVGSAELRMRGFGVQPAVSMPATSEPLRPAANKDLCPRSIAIALPLLTVLYRGRRFDICISVVPRFLFIELPLFFLRFRLV